MPTTPSVADLSRAPLQKKTAEEILDELHALTQGETEDPAAAEARPLATGLSFLDSRESTTAGADGAGAPFHSLAATYLPLDDSVPAGGARPEPSSLLHGKGVKQTLLSEFLAYREQAEQREAEMEAQLIENRVAIAALEGRVGELGKQLHLERRKSDALLKDDLMREVVRTQTPGGDGPPDSAPRSATLEQRLRTKLREVVAVHEVLQWQMHEKDKELRALEDILKVHLVLHPQPARPLTQILSARLPQFLERLQQGVPILADACYAEPPSA
eukprot:TRINITY_DN32864_c0_g1_i1.p1 TRINITY_DN32864_c0_g1~~TRINITY_DN32864_c0_g1_i1.p1  ORF type:complete len:273 (+),score=95.73 TRINITY_DN32864_c0_g1_i1:81-899(+)